MTVKYKIQAKQQPGVAGKTRYYAMPLITKKMTTEQVMDYISSRSRVLNKVVLTAAFYAFARTINELTREGYYVEMGDLGCFGINFSSEGMENPKDIQPRHINKVRYTWRPGPVMKKNLEGITYSDVMNK
jgi:predicted histone-like DNA-binding protein